MNKDWRDGVRAAAAVADEYNGTSTHVYRLGDCVAGKLNVGRARPRKNRTRVDPNAPHHAWTRGFVFALVEAHRLLMGGANTSGLRSVAVAARITVAQAKTAGCREDDVADLKRILR